MKRAPLNLPYRQPSSHTITHSLHVQECHPSFPTFSLHVAVHLIWGTDIPEGSWIFYCQHSTPVVVWHPVQPFWGSLVIHLWFCWTTPRPLFHPPVPTLDLQGIGICYAQARYTSGLQFDMYVRRCVCVWHRRCVCCSGTTGYGVLSVPQPVRDEQIWCHSCIIGALTHTGSVSLEQTHWGPIGRILPLSWLGGAAIAIEYVAKLPASIEIAAASWSAV